VVKATFDLTVRVLASSVVSRQTSDEPAALLVVRREERMKSAE
jgi:hypothetical protein